MSHNEEPSKTHMEFQASSNTWIKNSEYEIYVKKDSSDIWIKPKPDSEIETYQPFDEEIKGLILRDIIIIGKDLEENYKPYDGELSSYGSFMLPFIEFSSLQKLIYHSDKEYFQIKRRDCGGSYLEYAATQILPFVNRYGLFGFYTELDPANLSYTEEMKYFFPHYVGSPLPYNNIDYHEFWTNYSEPVFLIEQYARHIYFLSQVDSYFNSKKYTVGAKPERLHFPDDPCDLDPEVTWGQWFSLMMKVDEISIKPKYSKMVQAKYSNEKEVVSYNWQIDWVFPSLFKAIRLIQALNFMSVYQFVKTCKCGVTFVPKDIRADYCSIACRNRINVRKSRSSKQLNKLNKRGE